MLIALTDVTTGNPRYVSGNHVEDVTSFPIPHTSLTGSQILYQNGSVVFVKAVVSMVNSSMTTVLTPP